MIYNLELLSDLEEQPIKFHSQFQKNKKTISKQFHWVFKNLTQTSYSSTRKLRGTKISLLLALTQRRTSKTKNKLEQCMKKTDIYTCLCYKTTLCFDCISSFQSTGTPMLLDTQNPEISRFSTAHAYKYKTKQQAKMKRRQEKNDIFFDYSPFFPCT